MASIELSAKLLNTAANQPLVDAEDVWIDSTPITTVIAGKQDVISDLATIRSKANNAVQSSSISDMETKTHAAATYQPKGTYLTAHQDISGKVDKVSGKGLSTNDYTSAEKTKLSGIAEGAEVNVQGDWNVTDTASDAYIKNKPTGLATQSWVNSQGYLKAASDGSIELTGYIKESDFIQKYAVVEMDVTSFSTSSLTGSYSISVAGKPVTFDSGTLSIKCGSASATISGNVFTFNGNVLNSSTNSVSFVLSGKVDGVSISVTSPSITAYALPIKMGYLTTSNLTSSNLVSKYASTFAGINFDLSNTSNQNYLYLYIPKSMYTAFNIANKVVQVQDRKSPINTIGLEKQDITLTDYYVYKLDSTQKVGDYKWQTKLV